MAREVGAVLKLDVKEAKSKLKDLEREIKDSTRSKVKLEADLAKLNKLKKELSAIDTKIQSLSKRRISIEADATSYKKMRDEIDKLNRVIAHTQQQLNQINKSSFVSPEIKDTWSKNLNSQLKSYKDMKRVLTAESKQFKGAYDEAKKLDTQLQKLTDKGLKIAVDLKDEDVAKKQLDDIYATIGKLETNKADIQLKIDDYNQVMSQLDRINQNVSKLKSFGNSMHNVGKSMTNLFSGMSNNPIGKLGHFLVQGVGYSSLYRMTSEAMNLITESVDKAIGRYDTLTATKRNFLAMGESEKSYAEQMARLEKNIEGLPTTLDQSVQGIQGIYATTKDLGKSVDYFTALNDGILAFGGTQEGVKNATRQLVQAMGKGKLLAQDYNAIADAAPGLMGVMADSFGLSVGEMKEALSEGQISVESFLDHLVKLDKEGSGSMASLRDMAMNASKTWSASFTVMQTRVSKGIGTIIEAFNDIAKAATGKDVFELMWQAGDNMKNFFDGIGQTLKDNKGEIAEGINFIKDKIDELSKEFEGFDISSFFEGFKSFKWVLDGFKEGITFILDNGKKLAKFIGGGDTSKGLGRMVAGWFTFGYALRIAGKALNLVAGPMGAVAKAMVLMGRSEKKSFNFMGKISGMFGKKGDKLSSGKGLSVQTSFDKVGYINSMTNMSKMALMAGNIMLYAEALKQVDEKLPKDMNALVGKLTMLGLTMGAMQGVAIGFGKLNNYFGASTGLTGILSLIDTGGVMYVIAKCIKELDDSIPSDIGNFASKMANFGIAIGGFTAVIYALGGLATIGGGLGALIGVIGATFTMGLAGTMAVVGKSIGSFSDSMVQVARNLDKFQDVKLKDKNIVNNIRTILNSLEELGSYSNGIVDALVKLAEQKINEGNIAQANTNIKAILSVSKNLSKIQGTSISEDGLKTKITSLKNVLNSIKECLPLPTLNINANDSTSLSSQFTSLTSLAKAIQKFSSTEYESLNAENVKQTISQVADVIESLKTIHFPDVTKSIKAGLSVENANNISGVLDTLIAIIPKFGELTTALSTTPINKEEVVATVQKISETIGAINNMGLANGEGGSLGTNMKQFVKNKDIENAVNSFNSLIKLVKKCTELQAVFTESNIDFESLKTNILKVGTLIDSIVSSDKFDVDVEKIGQLTTAVDSLSDVITTLSKIGATEVNFEGINNMISQIGTVITNIKNITGQEQANSIVAQIQTLLTKFQELITTLSGLEGQFKEIGMNLGTALYTGFEEANVSVLTIEYITKLIADMKIQDFTPVGKKYGNDVCSGFKSTVSKLPSMLSGAISGLYTYSNSFANAGSSLGNSFTSSFNQALSNMKKPNASVPKGNKGGKVKYFDKGGYTSIFKPKGNDVIPAMLGAGEYVIQRNAVNGIGVRVLDKINSMDFKGALDELLGSHSDYSFNHSKNTTINNYTTNNYDNRQVSVNGGNERQQILRAGRFLRGMA